MNPNPPDVPPIITPTTPAPTVVTPPRFKFLLAVLVWLSVVLMGTGMTMILPEMFVSTVRIKVMPDLPITAGQSDQLAGAPVPDPNFMPTQAGMIYSEVVLVGVVEALELPQVWGRKYYEGQKLKISECIALLRGRLDVRVITNTSLMDIRSYSESAPDAALVANEVAKAYQKWRKDSYEQLARAAIRELQKQLGLQDQKLKWVKADLASVAEAGEAAPPNSSLKLTYLEKQKGFETDLGLQQELQRRIGLELVNLSVPRSQQVTVVDSAVPGLKPVRPNVPLNIILSIILGTMFGVTLAGLVYLFQWRAYRRKIGVYGEGHSPGLRNSLRVIIVLVVGLTVGYNCAMPVDAAGLVSFPLVLAAGGIGLGFVELANSTPLPPVAPVAEGGQESVPPRSF